MNQKEVQSVLIGALEDEIPSSEVNLWPAVKANLVAGKHQQGAEVNITKSRRSPRFAIAIPLALALLVVLLVTPQGRSFAQSVLEFFTRAESTAVPMNDSEAVPAEVDLAAPTAPPPAPLISVAEAETRVGFPVAELPSAPEGFDFLGVRLYGENVSMDYLTEGYGHLIILQSREGFYESEWDQVPAEDVIPVVIGELEGELVQGTFVRYPGETIARWNPEAAFTRLRWVDDGLWIEIALHGDAHQYLDLESLIELAASLTTEP